MIKLTLNATAMHGGATPAMKELAEQKLAFLDGRIADYSTVRVAVVPEGNRGMIVTASIVTPDDHHIRMSQAGTDFYEIMPQLAVRLRETLNQHKEKVTDAAHGSGAGMGADAADALSTREKCIVASEMSEEAAVAEAEALGHSWFVFRNVDFVDTPLSIVYQRVAGGWGVMILR